MWDYERVATITDGVIFLYIEGFITFIEKEELLNKIYEKSGWTYELLMEELERRLEVT